MLGPRYHFFLNKIVEERAEIIVKAVEIGLFFRADYGLPVGVPRRKHGDQF